MNEDRQVTGKLDIWDELSKVYNMPDVPDEAKSIIGDVMLGLPSEEPEPERNAASEQPVSDRLGVKTSKTCTDTISRQAAIDALESMSANYGAIGRREWHPHVNECMNEIRYLPSAQPERLTDDDLETIRIHLSAAKEKLCNQRRWEEAEEYERIISRLKTLESAQPEPKTGHWLVKQDRNGSTYGECSQCHSIQYAGHTPYCPYCGSHNGGEQNE